MTSVVASELIRLKMVVFRLLVVVAITAISNAAPTAIKRALHEERRTPSDWVKGSRIEGSAILPM
jgi:tripeptidyl-peptidase-1